MSPNPILEQTTSGRVEVEVPIAQNSWVLPRFMGEAVLRSDITLLTERSPLVRIQGLPEPPPTPPPPEDPPPPML